MSFTSDVKDELCQGRAHLQALREGDACRPGQDRGHAVRQRAGQVQGRDSHRLGIRRAVDHPPSARHIPAQDRARRQALRAAQDAQLPHRDPRPAASRGRLGRHGRHPPRRRPEHGHRPRTSEEAMLRRRLPARRLPGVGVHIQPQERLPLRDNGGKRGAGRRARAPDGGGREYPRR